MAIHMGYRQTGAVYTRRSGSVQIQPDRPPISVRARIGSNSTFFVFAILKLHGMLNLSSCGNAYTDSVRSVCVVLTVSTANCYQQIISARPSRLKYLGMRR